VQRGDRLVLPLPPGRLVDLVHPRRRGDARRRRDPRRPDVRRERPRPRALVLEAPRHARSGPRPAPAQGRAQASQPALPRRAGTHVSRRCPGAVTRRIPWELAALPLLGVSRLLPDTGWGLWVRLAAA